MLLACYSLVMIKFLPAYVGGKHYWVERLSRYQNTDIIELFCGSAVLSANLAKTAILNDKDPVIFHLLSHFDQLVVPEVFTNKDYFEARSQPDWWRYLFCLQKMSFSGVFRYSKNGYNVPVRKNPTEVRIQPDYLAALERWKQLKPSVCNLDYVDLPFSALKDRVIISDPPFQDSQAAYNTKSFDYALYWKKMQSLVDKAEQNKIQALVLFDRRSNLEKQGIPIIEIRKMRVNGKHDGGEEAIAIYEQGGWLTSLTATKLKVCDNNVC